MSSLLILVIGARESIWRLIIEEALLAGHRVRALVPAADEITTFPHDVEGMAGDINDAELMRAAVAGADAVVLTLHACTSVKSGADAAYYLSVRNLLTVLGQRQVRISMMTTLGVTNRFNSHSHAKGRNDWKRRAERLLRMSSQPYTIVRPGWFEQSDSGRQRLVLLQGDRRHARTPDDGTIAPRQIAQVLVATLVSAGALKKTFELVANDGQPAIDLESMFGMLVPDSEHALDGVDDLDNMPYHDEPDDVRRDLAEVIPIYIPSED